jgi:hypothetical protein
LEIAVGGKIIIIFFFSEKVQFILDISNFIIIFVSEI